MHMSYSTDRNRLEFYSCNSLSYRCVYTAGNFEGKNLIVNLVRPKLYATGNFEENIFRTFA